MLETIKTAPTAEDIYQAKRVLSGFDGRPTGEAMQILCYVISSLIDQFEPHKRAEIYDSVIGLLRQYRSHEAN
jgi:hypothetical protein